MLKHFLLVLDGKEKVPGLGRPSLKRDGREECWVSTGGCAKGRDQPRITFGSREGRLE